jgi:hypothetical protein
MSCMTVIFVPAVTLAGRPSGVSDLTLGTITGVLFGISIVSVPN